MAITILDITGRSETIAELNRRIQQLDGPSSEKAMRAAGLVVLGRARELTPVDTGNLINSSDILVGRVRGKWTVEVFYTAEYAPIVHETNRKYRKPGSQWKFLETAVNSSVQHVLDIIQYTLMIERGAA